MKKGAFAAPGRQPGFKVLLLMKLTTAIILAACLQVSAKGISQRINLQVSNESLTEVFRKIEDKTSCRFVYSKNVVQGKLVREASFKRSRLPEVLDALLAELHLSYKMINDSLIAIGEQPAGAVTVVDKIKISGRIVDSTGKPIQGVNVLVRGGSSGTSTDANGEFSIEAEKEDFLEISSVGYVTQVISLRDKPITGNSVHLSIRMAIDAKESEQVVVVGYAVQKKANLTGAVSSVKMEDVLGNRPVSSTSKALQGALPGLQITYGSGQPGAGVSLNVRGVTSINAAGGPLVLLDNVPVNIEDINPADIETVSLLKDASASSIYGARAAFGVLLITTKKGVRNQVPRFDYSTTLSKTSPSQLPEKPSPAEFLKALKDFGTITYWAGQDIQKWSDYLLEYQKNPGNYPNGMAKDGSIIYPLLPVDHSKDMFPGGFEQLHNFSFSGGNNKTSYRASFGYADENGILISDRDIYKRYNFNSYFTTDLTKNLTASVSAFYKNDKRTSPTNSGLTYYTAVTHPPMVATGYDTTSAGEYLPYSTPVNVIRIEDPQRDNSDVLRLFGKLEFRPLKGVKITGEYTFNKTNSETTLFTGINRYINPIKFDVVPSNSSSSFYKDNSQVNYNAINIYGSYDLRMADHNISVLAGMNNEVNKSEFSYIQRLDVLSSQVPSISTSTGTITGDDSYGEYEVLGYFGRINYSYKNRYLAEINGRYDGSSRFPKKNRFGFFPSFSLGWNLMEENFMEGMRSVFDGLKLRGSYGEIGNQNIANYGYLPGLNPVNASWINPSSGVPYVTLSTPALVRTNFTWERIRTKNLGIDIAMLSKRLGFSFDLFKRQTLDMLAPGAQLPATLGASAPMQNAADLESKGWEFEIAWRDKKKDVHYSFSFNLSDNQGYITKFDNPAGLISQYYVGQRLNDIWGYTTGGFYTVDDFVAGTLNSDLQNGTLNPGIPRLRSILPNPGDIRYVDLNNDSLITNGNNTLSNPGDLSIIGNSNRRFQFGFSGSVSYRNFDFSLFFQGIGKRDLWLNNNLVFPYQGQFGGLFKHQLNYWTPDHTGAYYARVYKDGAGNTAGASQLVQTRYLSNGAYLRVKNITLGYTPSFALLKRANLKNARVFVTAENLFTFSHLPKGLDAEAGSQSSNGGIYPFIRKIGFGVNISF
jgi:TonB-linked SusC/RagA family outer membrane protein